MNTGTNRRTSRSPRWSVVLVVLVLLAGACSDDDEPVAEQDQTTIPPARTLLRVGVEGWPDCLNPITCSSPELHEQVLQHVLPVLFELDAGGEYRPSPMLAGPPEVTTDVVGGGMAITYRIDPAAHWGDGQPITSSDIRGTWQAIMATDGADTAGYDLITAVDDEDPLVAVVHLSEPHGDWKELFGGHRGWVLQADAFGPSVDLTGQFEQELPFSAAPYRLAAWDDDAAVLTASADYWEPSRTPSVDQVRLTRVTVDELVEPGSFDLLVPAATAPGPAPEGFAPRTLLDTRVVGVWFDQRTPLLGVLPHRQALAALVNREELIAEVTARTPRPIDCLGWLPDVGGWCAEAAAELPEPDEALAAFALAIEGWTVNDSGNLFRGFEPFVVPVTHDPAVPGARAIADAVVDSFESVGIRVDRSAIANRTWAGARSGDQHTGVGVYELDLGVSPQVLGLYGCPAGPPSSVLAWCPDEIVEPARTLATAVDPERQADLVGEIGSVAADNVAWVPIIRQTRTSYVQSDRVAVPGTPPVAGGPLADLYDFTVRD